MPESLELVPIHPDQNSKDRDLFTALNSPKKNQAQKLLKIQQLLDGNANVNAQDSKHINPIHIAAKTNNPQLVSLILGKKADITLLTQKKSSCFHYAASTGAPQALKLLLHHEYQLLKRALLEPHIKIIMSLLSCFPTTIIPIILNYSLDQGVTSLMQEDINQQTALISTRNNLYKEHLPKKQRDLQQCIKLLQGHQKNCITYLCNNNTIVFRT